MAIEKFSRRLKYYGIGFGIGLVFVFVFFQNRGCSWLPENRIKNGILDRVVVMHQDEVVLLEKAGFNFDDVEQLLNDGDVEFSESQRSGDLKSYVVQREFEKKGELRMEFSLSKGAFISEGKLVKGNFSISKTGVGKIVRLPKDQQMVYLDTMSIGANNAFVRGLSAEAIYKRLQTKGLINFSQSTWAMNPLPEQTIGYSSSQDTTWLKGVWFENKIKVFEVSRTGTPQ